MNGKYHKKNANTNLRLESIVVTLRTNGARHVKCVCLLFVNKKVVSNVHLCVRASVRVRVWRNRSYKIEIKCLDKYLDPRDLKFKDILCQRLYFLLLRHLSHEGYKRQNATFGMGTKNSRNNHCGKHFVKRLFAVNMRKICHIIKNY